MSKFKVAMCALAVSAISSFAHAAAVPDGMGGDVNFDGELITETCKVDDASKNIMVTLPTLPVSSLTTAGNQAGSTKFEIKVIDCPAAIKQVAAHFEGSGTDFNYLTGNLNNTATATPATNVEVALYDADTKQITVGTTGKSFPVAADGTATLRYFGGYYATGTTTPGKVQAKAIYTLAYN